MTDKNKTDITVVLDRSGSMFQIQGDMVGGFNRFVGEQAKQPGECLFSLYRFDHHFETVFEGLNAWQVPPLELVPRGNTALLDAVGRAIVATGQRLAALPEDQRPGAVIFMIITDGQENASTEYTYAMVQDAIARQKSEFNWQFVYLGSDLSTSREAQRLGTQALNYQANAQGVGAMYASMDCAVSSLREVTRRGVGDAQLEIEPKHDGDPA